MPFIFGTTLPFMRRIINWKDCIRTTCAKAPTKVSYAVCRATLSSTPCQDVIWGRFGGDEMLQNKSGECRFPTREHLYLQQKRLIVNLIGQSP
jgi:hypothetical protein